MHSNMIPLGQTPHERILGDRAAAHPTITPWITQISADCQPEADGAGRNGIAGASSLKFQWERVT